jgi:hypothetical protein
MSYAYDCKRVHPDFEYHVMKNGKLVCADVVTKGEPVHKGSWLLQGTRQSKAVK